MTVNASGPLGAANTQGTTEKSNTTSATSRVSARRPSFKKTTTAGMSAAFNDKSNEATARLAMLLLASLQDGGIQFPPGHLRELFGKNVYDRLNTLKTWGIVTQDSTLTHINVPSHIAWANREYVKGGAEEVDWSRWIAMPKTASSAIEEAYQRGMPMWIALPLFVNSTASFIYGVEGRRELHMTYADLAGKFIKVNSETGEVKEATRKTFLNAMEKSKQYGLLIDDSRMGKLAVWTPSSNKEEK